MARNLSTHMRDLQPWMENNGLLLRLRDLIKKRCDICFRGGAHVVRCTAMQISVNNYSECLRVLINCWSLHWALLLEGCLVITGKAMMLDEIINYVQSLQHQVEFLSMKLATVNRELNVDIDQILSKNILNSQGGNANTHGINPGLSPSHTFRGFSQGNFNGLPGTVQPFYPLPHALFDHELRSILQRTDKMFASHAE